MLYRRNSLTPSNPCRTYSDAHSWLIRRLSVILFLDSCCCHRRLKAASMLGGYLENAEKVVPQNMHFHIDL